MMSGQHNALEDYNTRLVQQGQPRLSPFDTYNFARGFEYGIQFVIDQLDQLRKMGL